MLVSQDFRKRSFLDNAVLSSHVEGLSSWWIDRAAVEFYHICMYESVLQFSAVGSVPAKTRLFSNLEVTTDALPW